MQCWETCFKLLKLCLHRWENVAFLSYFLVKAEITQLTFWTNNMRAAMCFKKFQTKLSLKARPDEITAVHICQAAVFFSLLNLLRWDKKKKEKTSVLLERHGNTWLLQSCLLCFIAMLSELRESAPKRDFSVTQLESHVQDLSSFWLTGWRSKGLKPEHSSVNWTKQWRL